MMYSQAVMKFSLQSTHSFTHSVIEALNSEAFPLKEITENYKKNTRKSANAYFLKFSDTGSTKTIEIR